jgi:hypothetical protein
MTDILLAIDLGKYMSVVCLYGPATTEAEFRTLDTSRAELTRLIVRARPAVVVVEACTPPGWVRSNNAANRASRAGLVGDFLRYHRPPFTRRTPRR